MMDSPFGRIPSRGIIIEPDDYTISYTFEGTIGELFDRYPGVTICVVGMMIHIGDGRSVDIDYDSVDDINRQGYIFQREDRVIVRYKSNERV
jgi:hypothetical protein